MPKHLGPIVVIGSINMDLVCRTPSMPAAGQTILGSNFVTIPGGKGANQAVAAAKLVSRVGGGKHNGKANGHRKRNGNGRGSAAGSERGGASEVFMIGRVGDDDFGQRLLNGLIHHGVNTRHVTVTEATSSGCALIVVDEKGENSIVVVPGANHKLTPADIDAAELLIASASVVLLQLEIPLATVRHAIATCQRLGVFTVLDPAPVPPRGLTRHFFGVDVFTPNQSEAELLLGMEPTHQVTRKKSPDPKQIGSELLARGPAAVLLKLGKRGAMIVGRNGHIEPVGAFKVKVVDSTAAGDAFTGAFAVGHSEGMELALAVRFANAAGALCCTGFGAQPSLPMRQQVDALLAGQ